MDFTTKTAGKYYVGTMDMLCQIHDFARTPEFTPQSCLFTSIIERNNTNASFLKDGTTIFCSSFRNAIF